MSTMVNFPCRNCIAPKRHIGCHGTCEEYIKAKAHNDELNDMRRREKQEETAQYENASRIRHYAKREKRRKK